MDTTNGMESRLERFQAVPIVRGGAARVNEVIVRLLVILFVIGIGEEPRLYKQQRKK